MRGPVGGKEDTGGSPPGNATAGGGDVSDGVEAQQLLKKGPWTASEDAILLEYVRKHGEGNWNAVQKNSSLQRCGKSCRLRWANHLRPNLKKGSFSPEEEILILQLHAELGNKWARMAAQLPGRTDNEIKNYWNTRIKRRQRAGLPLYPPEIQQRAAFMNQRKGSLMLLENPTRPRNFLTAVSPTDATMFSNAGGGNFLLENFELGPPPLPLHASNFSMKIELPSSQFFLADKPPPPPSLRQGNSGPFDAAHPESPGVGESFNYGPLTEQFSTADYATMAEPPQSSKSYGVDPLCKLGSSDFSIGIHSKKPMAEMAPPVNQDLSALIEMIPMNTITPSTQILSDWCSSGPSSMVTDDDLRHEMQKLASTLSMGHDWGLGSCSWDNIPSIS